MCLPEILERSRFVTGSNSSSTGRKALYNRKQIFGPIRLIVLKERKSLGLCLLQNRLQRHLRESALDDTLDRERPPTHTQKTRSMII